MQKDVDEPEIAALVAGDVSQPCALFLLPASHIQQTQDRLLVFCSYVVRSLKMSTSSKTGTFCPVSSN